jgi:predicted NUDIX family NTP pyrophosphohydrolase
MKQSAGTLLYRAGPQGLEVLLVHPSGNYNRRAPWGIPKGVPNKDEPLEAAARRETREEANVEAVGELIDLGYIDYTKSRKRVFCFAGPAPEDADARLVSWEVDRAEFVPLEKARQIIHRDQAVFLDRLLEKIGPPPAEGVGEE